MLESHSRHDLRQVVQAHPVAPAHVVDGASVLRVEALHEGEKRSFVFVGLRPEPASIVVLLFSTGSGGER